MTDCPGVAESSPPVGFAPNVGDCERSPPETGGVAATSNPKTRSHLSGADGVVESQTIQQECIPKHLVTLDHPGAHGLAVRSRHPSYIRRGVFGDCPTTLGAKPSGEELWDR